MTNQDSVPGKLVRLPQDAIGDQEVEEVPDHKYVNFFVEFGRSIEELLKFSKRRLQKSSF